MVGCKGIERGVTEKEIVRIVEKETLVPFANPADSLTLTALLECDSMSNILIRELDEYKSDRFSTRLSVNKGQIEYRIKKSNDTVYVPVKEKQEMSSTDKHIHEVIIEKENIRGLFWWSGLVAWVLLIIWLAIKVNRLYR